MARAIYYRYCSETPERYETIGRRLGLTPEHARRLVDRGLGILSRSTGGLTEIEGTRLWPALEKRRLRRRNIST